MKISQSAIALLVLLAACSDDQPPANAPAKPVDNVTELPGQPAPGSLPVDEPIPPAVQPEVKPEPDPVTESEPAPSLPSGPVDLSLPPALLDGLHLGEPIEDEQPQPLLPPLFVEKPKPESSVHFSGQLLLNDEVKDNYKKSVDGAELQMEIKR